jgi:lipoprotein signal peptidase
MASMFGLRVDPEAARSERLLALLVIATGLAAVDQWVKLTVPTPLWAIHHRSDLWFFGSCVVLIAMLPLTRLPSRALSIAAGILCGGVLGNLLSASTGGLDVPNPIIVMHGVGGVAFNPADAFIEAGNVALIATLVCIALRRREELSAWRARARETYRGERSRRSR